MKDETRNLDTKKSEAGEYTKRREALLKMGKFAAYAAPFTVMALTAKADGGSEHKGHHRHPPHGRG